MWTIPGEVYDPYNNYFVFYAVEEDLDPARPDALRNEVHHYRDEFLPWYSAYRPNEDDVIETIYYPRAEESLYFTLPDLPLIGWFGYCVEEGCNREICEEATWRSANQGCGAGSAEYGLGETTAEDGVEGCNAVCQ